VLSVRSFESQNLRVTAKGSMMSYRSWSPRPKPDNERQVWDLIPMLRVGPEPRAQPIETFEGGHVIIRFQVER
jgi:hypothetical protein